MAYNFTAEQLADRSFTPEMRPMKGTTLESACIAWVVLCTVSLLLRLWSRFTSSAIVKLQSDDWFAMAAWPLVTTLNITILTMTYRGFGNHANTIPLGNLVYILKIYFAGNIIYPVGMTCARMSAVLFYRRIFTATNRTFRMLLWGSLAMNVVWCLIIVLISVFECLPVYAVWDPTADKTCHVYPLDIILSSSATSVFIDLWILLLPLPMLYRLQMSRTKRALLIAVFVSGYFVVVASIGRLVSIVQNSGGLNTDVTYALVTPIYWIISEISLAAVCINLPSIFHLVRRWQQHGVKSLFTSRVYPAVQSPPASNKEAVPKRANRMWPTPAQMKFARLGCESSATAGAYPDEDGEAVKMDELENGMIRKTYDVSVTTQPRSPRSPSTPRRPSPERPGKSPPVHSAP